MFGRLHASHAAMGTQVEETDKDQVLEEEEEQVLPYNPEEDAVMEDTSGDDYASWEQMSHDEKEEARQCIRGNIGRMHPMGIRISPV